MKSNIKKIAILCIAMLASEITHAQSWSIIGNAGTNASTNFIGTTDNVALKFKTKNTVRMTINTAGYVGVGTTTPLSLLHIQKTLTGTPITTPVLARFSNGTLNGYTKIILGSDNSSSDGFSTFTAGSTASTQLLGFGVGNAGSTTTQLNLDGNGNVGIGTTTPAFPLEISSSQNSQLHFCVPAGGPYYTSLGFGYKQIGNNTCARIDLGFESLYGNSNSYLSFRTGQSPYAGNSDITQERMRINSEGNVGIGTTTPGEKLDVAGRMRVQAGNGNAGIWLMDPGNSFDAAFWGIININHFGFYASALGNWGLNMNLDNGNVGIGIGANDAAYKLDVCGTIRSKEIRVETGWCDYVFANDYMLAPLREVETYIKENKHLPGVTAGNIIETEGLEVGKTSAQMIKKIEELTLYVIEQEKSIESLKLQNAALESKINSVLAKGGN